MKNKILLIIISVIVIIVIVIIINPSSSQDEFVNTLDVSAEEFNRTYTPFNKVDTHVISDTTKIFRPATVRIYNDQIYISDFSNFTIYIFAEDGMQTGKIETGRGQGPGEFAHLTDFDVCAEKIWAVDSQNLRISSFSLKTSEVINTISVERRPTRITCLKDGFVVKWFGSELLFSKFDYSGNEIKNFGKIIEDQILHSVSLDGTIRSNKEDKFVYIPFYASLIYYFDGEGNLIHVLKAADGFSFPATRREGAVFFAPDFVLHRDGYIDGAGNLYVYKQLPGKKNNQDEWIDEQYSVIDKYNLIKGVYEKSIEVPFMHSSVMFNSKVNTIFSANYEKAFRHQLDNTLNF
jgi:hypothetical protein